MIKLKIICHTPKGKAKASAKSFKRYFSVLKRPIDSKIIGDNKFFYVYEYETQKEVDKVINHKIPKAEMAIRSFYSTIMALVDRANKLGKKGAWNVLKMKRWIMRRLIKKYQDKETVKGFEDFLDAIDMSDKKEMMDFLTKPLIEHEVLK